MVIRIRILLSDQKKFAGSAINLEEEWKISRKFKKLKSCKKLKQHSVDNIF